MFSFGGLFRGVRPHLGAAVVVLFLVVVFLSAPFLLVYRTIRTKVPGASALPPK
jgi:hypothetical protein